MTFARNQKTENPEDALASHNDSRSVAKAHLVAAPDFIKLSLQIFKLNTF